MNEAFVTVMSLGGTISCLPESGSRGVVPTLEAADLVQTLISQDAAVEMRAKTWSTRDSSEITFNELIDLATEVRSQYEEGAAGVIVTQGTDTIEETVFTLDLLLGLTYPVVVTGAMRDPSRPGADGTVNLEAALLVATSEELSRTGSVVVLNDEIHGARWVRKTHTSNVAAFQSPGAGPLGWIIEGQPHFLFAPMRVPEEAIPAQPGDERVFLHTAQMDDDPAVIDFVSSHGYAGVVIAGMGGGHVSGEFAKALGGLAEKIPVVFTSRTGAGGVLRQTYSSPGAEMDLIHRGLIPAGSLDDLKSRILLTLLMRSGADVDDIATAFAHHGEYATMQKVEN